MKKYIANYWFFGGIALVIPLALAFPVLGLKIKQGHLLEVGIFFIFFITGLTLEPKNIVKEIRNIKALVAALLSCFIFFPLMAVILVRIFFSRDTDFIVGVCILAVVPVTIASGNILSALAKGNISLSLFICVVSNFLAIFTIPFCLRLLLQHDQQINLPAGQMIKSLLYIVLLPTLIGQVLRIKFQAVIRSCAKGFTIFSQLVVLLIIFNAFSSSASGLQDPGWSLSRMAVFMLVLHGIILMLNYALAKVIKLDLPSTAAFTIHTSQKTLTISFIVWSGYFSQFTLGMIPTIIYHLVQLVVDTFVARRFRTMAEKLEMTRQ